LRKILVVPSLAALILVLSGCGVATGSGDASTDVVGKIQTKPYIGQFGEEGDGCAGPEFSHSFNGQQVTLKDAAGAIVGIATLQGWGGDPSRDLSPDSYGYNDGAMCSWDFTFPGVALESDFYTLEFSSSNVAPPTFTKEELINGPVVALG
jgi:hypothetical protein